MRNIQKFAFTLVEMLVVVAIIMVLATLLFPALGRDRESARNTRCSSNLRQLQVATLSYASDTINGINGYLPPAASFWHDDGDGTKTHWHGWIAWYDIPGTGGDDKKGSGGQYAWVGTQGYSSITNGALWGYMSKSADTYLCPTFAFRSVCGQSSPKFSYAMNSQVSRASILGLQGATLVLFGDNATLVGMASPTTSLISQFTTNQLGKWHNKKGNVVYVDGHIEHQ